MSKSLETLKAVQREALEKQNNIKDAVTAQKREMTAEEKAEFNAAGLSFDVAAREITALNQSVQTVQKPINKNEALRELVKSGKHDIVLQRSFTGAQVNSGENYIDGRAVPVTVEDVINPLELPTIYNAVGLQIQTGVRGQLQWPCLDNMITVAKKGETVAVGDSDINFSAIIAKPIRLALSVDVTNENIDNAAFDVYGFVTEQMNRGLARVIDNALLASTAWDSDFFGPFADSNIAQYKTSATPTYAELLAMKGKVMAAGADMVGFAYVMNPTTYSTLEATPITTGDSRTIISDGKIAGYPVYVTKAAYLADGYVGCGCFGYVALNQHGDSHFIVDPYSQANAGVVRFTLNADWSLTVLKENAFCLGYAAATTADAQREHRKDK